MERATSGSFERAAMFWVVVGVIIGLRLDGRDRKAARLGLTGFVSATTLGT